MNIYQDISYLYVNKCRNEINVESNYAALKRYLGDSSAFGCDLREFSHGICSINVYWVNKWIKNLKCTPA